MVLLIFCREAKEVSSAKKCHPHCTTLSSGNEVKAEKVSGCIWATVALPPLNLNALLCGRRAGHITHRMNVHPAKPTPQPRQYRKQQLYKYDMTQAGMMCNVIFLLQHANTLESYIESFLYIAQPYLISSVVGYRANTGTCRISASVCMRARKE